MTSTTSPAYQLTAEEKAVILLGGTFAVFAAQNAINRCLHNASNSAWMAENQEEFP